MLESIHLSRQLNEMAVHVQAAGMPLEMVYTLGNRLKGNRKLLRDNIMVDVRSVKEQEAKS